MAFNLRNRHFLKLDDFTPQEIRFLLQLATELKAAKFVREHRVVITHSNGPQVGLLALQAVAYRARWINGTKSGGRMRVRP